MSAYTSRAFWVATAERAIRTGAQAAVAAIGTTAVGILDVDWQGILAITALAMVIAVLTCMGAAQVGSNGPSLTTSEQLTPPAAPVEGDAP